MDLIIEVRDDEEAELIRSGLENEAVRAFVKITAALAQLPDNDSKKQAVMAACIMLGVSYPDRGSSRRKLGIENHLLRRKLRQATAHAQAMARPSPQAQREEG